ncbi:efflux RND transporter periplasmic adaptor subunit [Stenotrophobium rhamnosiphilum]|uniref:Efflux transporter periplasmic adaptor subunit n=1 Tax=Stenotrophobium rhamnosiphilum TaxID=2029166 RepID=A0A2T5ME45_9GAMM|nr:efflux RND transporter periplasmic adaptor subunit [Stenotrophobium rhamnosiphilum]PTU30848.1 efflux transporter periplasmic adaptor subunit [Stenotrophobium rhamnosiphilum]
MPLRKPGFKKFYVPALIGVPAFTALVLAIGLGRTEAKAQPAAPVATEVTVAEVIHKPLHEWQEFSGRLQAVDTVEVRPRVNGYIDRVAFPDGARVTKGQLLFQIDPRPFQAEVDRLTSERARALSDLDLARANHARAERLIAENAISREEYERLVAAENSAQGEVGSVSGSLAAARLNLEFTQVRAPIEGHVSRAIITAGNLVTSSSLLTTVVSDNPVYAYFDADEQTFLRYAKAKRDPANKDATGVFMGLVDEEGYPHQGELNFVDNQVDPTTGTIRARAVFANPEGRYTPGLFARIRLVGGADAETVLIEDRAVGTDLGKKFVFALKPDKSIEARFVELGPVIDGLRVVKQGLVAGDVIVVNGLQHVKSGEVVAPTRIAMNTDNDGLRQVLGSSAAPSLVAQEGTLPTVRARP